MICSVNVLVSVNMEGKNLDYNLYSSSIGIVVIFVLCSQSDTLYSARPTSATFYDRIHFQGARMAHLCHSFNKPPSKIHYTETFI